MKRKSISPKDLSAEISNDIGLSKKWVYAVLVSLASVAKEAMGARGGEFTVPGVVKIKARPRRARPARTMKSLRTGEEIQIPAKPAGHRAAALVLKPIRDAVESAGAKKVR